MTNSITLVVIRIELIDDSPELDLHYSAPNFFLDMEDTSEAEKVNGGTTEEIRGCRQIDEVTVETLVFNETTKSSGQPSKDRSPRSSSSSSQRHSLRSSTDSDAVPGSYAAAVAHKSVASASSPTEPSPLPPGIYIVFWCDNMYIYIVFWCDNMYIYIVFWCDNMYIYIVFWCDNMYIYIVFWCDNMYIYIDSPDSYTERGAPRRSRPKSATAKLSSTVDFYCGNPSVERVQGILHLYKDSKKTSMTKDASRSELICMLSVPATFSLHDLLQFTDHVYQGIEYMKIIRDMSPNRYMVLVKFKSQELADEFYINYNGTQFNSIEPNICHLVYVAQVDFRKESEGGAVPIPGLIELPNCPVCLERMDESVDGILTILCNHAFHGNCLKKWGDTSCPVCRYSQTPEESGENSCFECDSTESLWICLICGHVGCGRYVEGHAYRHFAKTNHTYSMQLSTGRVWDYVGDNYVHRLIQNKEDGKLVEMDERSQRVNDEKLDSLTLEVVDY
ncbi:hypothetical protein EB796_021758 [Bugula neritina]|uniref:BRAP n=1 Tax=Bugula neritina TaxID=10212 RepID=A0A7J7J3C3_BUGNE|nr:hypothetical protein EB796_021758 [Bugula neritina]